MNPQPIKRGVVAQTKDQFPKRARAQRWIEGVTPTGIKISGLAYADPIPGTLDYGPFYGEGAFSLARGGSYVVGNVRFEEIPEIIALLQEVLDAATAPGDPEAIEAGNG